MSFLDSAEDPKKIRVLKFFLAAALVVGAAASVFAQPAVPLWFSNQYYFCIAHRCGPPPDGLFAGVWAALYVLMAVAAWRVWKVSGLRSPEMALYAAQLALNLLWRVLLSRRDAGLALGGGLVLSLLILVTLIVFFRRDRLAGLLFLPNLAWTGFATLLTLAFWRLNQ